MRVSNDLPWTSAAFCALFFYNSHRHTSHTPNDFCLRWIIEMSDRLARLWMWNDHQLPFVELTPATEVSVPQLDEVNGPLEFRSPLRRTDFSLTRIDLHQRSRANERIQSVVFKTDVAIHRFAQVKVLKQADRNFVPLFYHPRQKVRFLETELRFEFNGKRHALDLPVPFPVHEVRSRDSNRSAISAQVRDP